MLFKLLYLCYFPFCTRDLVLRNEIFLWRRLVAYPQSIINEKIVSWLHLDLRALLREDGVLLQLESLNVSLLFLNSETSVWKYVPILSLGFVTGFIHVFFICQLVAQISEELEQRFGMMETSLSRFGMMLDSIQSDIMQANRGTKEVFLESEFYDSLILSIPDTHIWICQICSLLKVCSNHIG